MKNLIIVMALMAVGIHAQLTKIAVMNLSSNSMQASDVVSITNAISQELFTSGYFDIMERAAIDKIFAEQGLQQAGVTENEVAKVGKIIGVQKMFLGSVEQREKHYSLVLKLVNVETGRVENMISEEYKGDLDGLLGKGIKKMVKKFTKEDLGLKAIEIKVSFIATRKGKTFDVKSGDTLKSGDRLRLTLKPNQRCHVYVINKDARENFYTLFPNPAQRYKALSADEEYSVPNEGESFELDEVTGREYVYIIASLTPLNGIESLIYQDDNKILQKEKVLDQITTRGFARIVKSDNMKIKLDKGINFEGNSNLLSGSESFQYNVFFEHTD